MLAAGEGEEQAAAGQPARQPLCQQPGQRLAHGLFWPGRCQSGWRGRRQPFSWQPVCSSAHPRRCENLFMLASVSEWPCSLPVESRFLLTSACLVQEPRHRLQSHPAAPRPLTPAAVACSWKTWPAVATAPSDRPQLGPQRAGSLSGAATCCRTIRSLNGAKTCPRRGRSLSGELTSLQVIASCLALGFETSQSLSSMMAAKIGALAICEMQTSWSFRFQ